MRAGRFNRRLELLRRSVGTDALGGEVESWGVLATVWAERVSARVSERLANAQQSATTAALFRIRYAPAWADLSALDRVREVSDGRVYAIQGAEQPSRVDGVDIAPNTLIEITATARSEPVE